MNIYVLPTDKPSRGYILGKCIKNLSDVKIGQFTETYYLMFDDEYFQAQHIYITTDESPKLDEWGINIKNNVIYRDNGFTQTDYEESYCKKIIATTNLELIENGVQNISDEFLEWFVKNPSCEEIEVEITDRDNNGYGIPFGGIFYKIIIPKEEHKQETIEEVAEKYAEGKSSSSVFQEAHKKDFINGAKWQQERSYSEENIKNLIKIIELVKNK
jgi:hypothetical protein